MHVITQHMEHKKHSSSELRYKITTSLEERCVCKKHVNGYQKDMWDLWDVSRMGNWFQPRIIDVKDFLQISSMF